MGYLAVTDYLFYMTDKNLVGEGISIEIIEVTVKLLEEKRIIIPQVLNINKVYAANGKYTKTICDLDLTFNILFGFNYIIEKYQQSVVKIENINKVGDSSIGTGFVIKYGIHQLIITNKHVIDESKKLNILTKDDSIINYETPFLDPKRDIAIIPIKNKIDVVEFYLSLNIEILSDIITIGYPSIPMTKLAYQVYHKGEVNSFVEDYYDNKLFIISAKTSSGNSGSPVIDKSGMVIGIVTEELFEKDLFKDKGKLPYYAAIPTEEIYVVISNYLNIIKKA